MNEGFEAAQALTNTDVGRRSMSEIRALLNEMQKAENQILEQRLAAAAEDLQNTYLALVIGATLGLALLSLSFAIINREVGVRRRSEEDLQRLNHELDARVEQRTAELITSEGNFRNLLESAPDAMIIVNERGGITLVNAQTERLFGYPRAELIGQSIEILIPQRFSARHPAHRAGFFASPRVREMGVGLELGARRKDGSEFSVSISLSSLETAEGLLTTAAIRDVTEVKRAEAALQAKQELFESTFNLSPMLARWQVCSSVATEASGGRPWIPEI